MSLKLKWGPESELQLSLLNIVLNTGLNLQSPEFHSKPIPMPELTYSRLSEVLAAVTLPEAPKRFTDTEFYRHWSQAAGQSIAENTTRLQIEGCVLAVTVNSPTWAHELINNQTTVLSRLVENGYKDLEEISIRVAVAGGRKPSRRNKPERPIPQDGAVSPELRQLFAEIARSAANAETRETFLRLSRTGSPKE